MRLSGLTDPRVKKGNSGMKILARYSLLLLTVLFSVATCLASDYEDEQLYEVLQNARLREAPSLSSTILALIPGGFVVSAMEPEDGEWLKIQEALEEYPVGYIHKSLLADYTLSYSLEEHENEFHRIKQFTPASSLSYVYPQSHSRIYSREGEFLTHFPRISDTIQLGGVQITPGGFDSNSPYYYLRSHTGGAHCCFGITYVSKDPLYQEELSIDLRYSDSIPEMYDSTGTGEWRVAVNDWSYAYWLYSFSASPAPEVILKVDKGQLVPSLEDMKSPEPPHDHLVALSKGLKLSMDRDGSEFISKLTSALLDLYYSGNAESALELLNTVWTEGQVIMLVGDEIDREKYLVMLHEKIKGSPYYQDTAIRDSRRMTRI